MFRGRMKMKRYWVIAAYDSTKTEIFEKVWEYDLRNGTIDIGRKNNLNT